MENKIRVKVRIGEYEVEVESRKDELGDALSFAGQIGKTIDKLKAETPVPTVKRKMKISPEIVKEEPQITSRKLSEAILQVLKSQWATHPRTLREIQGVLELNALRFKLASIAGQLNKFTRRGIVRRLKKGNLYSYVISQR